ncbi:General secretory pathway protein E [Sulfurovum sp. enrichment culture clone C5]|uniref:General secretory pathway protein E n=1 Tax=Sulfurovum sp. enrichment culture clone C5 TaxID=497650 RepID=A0A0S4XQX8_9BACT|nr:General secretory pathway protein E [Sulfurovum sp. enrichment culture clone C5]
MVKVIQMMINENIVTKSDIEKLVRMRPPKKITFANLIAENFLKQDVLEKFLIQKIRQGEVAIEQLDHMDGFEIGHLLEKLAEELNIKYINLEGYEIDMKLFLKFPFAQLMKHSAIPIDENDLNVTIAFADPFDLEAQEALQRLIPKKPIIVAFAQPKLIAQNLHRLETSESIKNIISEIRKDLTQKGNDFDNEEDSAIIKLIDIIIKASIYAGASDIHVEALEKSCTVRIRVDGLLRELYSFDKDIFAPLDSRMKLLSNLDIAEKRKPQDGRFTKLVNAREYDFRVSTLPTLMGESIVLRILDKSKVMIKLEDGGMNKVSFEKFSEAIKVPYGIVLVTGPTGSGKTTTLYGAINAIRDVKDKIITVEDPVEYQLNGIQQVQVNNNANLTFSTALRSILRQDPDKIMIGEIRDQETLRIAIQAALTGHLVLSTLHTNDAISAVTRILDMGIESYLVSGALIAIQAQRLVRKLCPHCKTAIELPEHLLKDIREYIPENPTFYKGAGCKECNHSGYGGREMISEVLVITEKLSRMIASNASKEEMTKQAIEDGFMTMFEDGIRKALDGKTTVEEVYRVARL